jgi:hypothetical protein
VKRTFTFIGLAFVILAPPAHAQQDGEYQAKNEKVQATGNATDGTCEPTDFTLLIEILFGPGNKVETVQGEQRTVGKFDPETGKIMTSSGPESYILKPVGKKGLTGFNTYDECRWTINFKLNQPGLVFVETEAAPEAVASPTATQVQQAPAGAVGSSEQKKTGGGLPVWIPLGIAGGGVAAGTAYYFLTKVQPSSESVTTQEAGATTATASGSSGSAETGGPPAGTVVAPGEPKTVIDQPSDSSAPKEFFKRCLNCGYVGPWSEFIGASNFLGPTLPTCPICDTHDSADHGHPLSDAEDWERGAHDMEFIAQELGDALGTAAEVPETTPEQVAKILAEGAAAESKTPEAPGPPEPE